MNRTMKKIMESKEYSKLVNLIYEIKEPIVEEKILYNLENLVRKMSEVMKDDYN